MHNHLIVDCSCGVTINTYKHNKHILELPDCIRGYKRSSVYVSAENCVLSFTPCHNVYGSPARYSIWSTKYGQR